ncbi:hypothetical protein [Marinifilum fragile]|uniref:hypothetical protein n=1 Tax=Marinifilum fragile TaxID=570161 RepID=UPI002AAC3938|nr:hypothetical protein [Marinifilum fragile]
MLSMGGVAKNLLAKCSRRVELAKSTWQNALNEWSWQNPRGKMLSMSRFGKSTWKNALDKPRGENSVGKELSTSGVGENQIVIESCSV